MARPASRKAVSSLPAIANIDEQLDEVVMKKFMRALAILFGIDYEMEKKQEDIALASLERDWRLHKLQMKILNDISTLGR